MDVIVLDDSLAETPIDEDPVEIEYPRESVEQLLQRANASIAAFNATRKRLVTVPTVTVRASSEMEAAVQNVTAIRSSNAASRNQNECDDDVIFVGETPVINLCSPYKDRYTVPVSAAASVPQFPKDSEPKENTVMCAVCMESAVGRQPHSTNCGHIFCGSCIKEAIKRNRKCPLCNKGLTVKNIFPVFI